MLPEVLQTLRESGIDPTNIHCNSKVAWTPNLQEYSRGIVDTIEKLWTIDPPPALKKKAYYQTLGYLVRSSFEQLQTQNLGVVQLKERFFADSAGKKHPLLVFRSAVIIEPKDAGSCFNSLIKQAKVKHVINLYGGSFPLQDKIEEEKEQSRRLGVSYFDSMDQPDLEWRKLVEQEEDYQKNLKVAMERLAKIIHQQILRPGGKSPRGNLYIHCAGGMHRSGIVFGVLRRCLNGDPFQDIEREYKQHTAFTSDQQPGGFEALNLKFINDFDCSLLKSL